MIRLFVPCFLIIFLCNCSVTQPVFNLKGSPILSMKNPTVEKVQSAIMDAGKHIGWVMKVVTKGHIVASHQSGSHKATVDILFNLETYDILYKDSQDLSYDGTTIHRRYNRWVVNLDKTIRRMLQYR